LIAIEVEVCGCSVCEVLKPLVLLSRDLPLRLIVTVLWLNVLFRLEVQNLGLIFFDRLRLVRMIEGDICLFVGGKRLLNQWQILL